MWYVAEPICDRLRGGINHVLISQQHESRRGRTIFPSLPSPNMFNDRGNSSPSPSTTSSDSMRREFCIFISCFIKSQICLQFVKVVYVRKYALRTNHNYSRYISLRWLSYGIVCFPLMMETVRYNHLPESRAFNHRCDVSVSPTFLATVTYIYIKLFCFCCCCC